MGANDMDRSANDIPDLVAAFIETLGAHGMEVEYGAVSESFGNMTVRCRRRSLVVSVVRERSLWDIEVDGPRGPCHVLYWRVCLDGVTVESLSPHRRGDPVEFPNRERNLEDFTDRADWVTRRLADLEEASESLTIEGCLRQAIRQHNEHRFGWSSDGPIVMVPRERRFEQPPDGTG